MKFKSLIASSALIVGTVVAAHAYDGQKYAKDAKVSLEQAREIALKVLPGGKISKEELEHEKGGSGLRYTFDIAVGQSTHEVGVDAENGAILENSVEGKDKD